MFNFLKKQVSKFRLGIADEEIDTVEIIKKIDELYIHLPIQNIRDEGNYFSFLTAGPFFDFGDQPIPKAKPIPEAKPTIFYSYITTGVQRQEIPYENFTVEKNKK